MKKRQSLIDLYFADLMKIKALFYAVQKGKHPSRAMGEFLEIFKKIVKRLE